jgi:hypothetical protein
VISTIKYNEGVIDYDFKPFNNNDIEEIFGCTIDRVKEHIESQFKPGMSWENHGEWHIDHIIPVKWFVSEFGDDAFYMVNHYTNLQPLWAKDNLSKKDSVNKDEVWDIAEKILDKVA